MKKRIAVLLCMTLMTAVSLNMAACGSKDNGTSSADQDQSSVQSPAEETPAESGAPAVDEEPGADDFEEEEFTGWSGEMAAIKEAITAELGDNYWPSMAVPAGAMEGLYGISADMYDDYLAETPMMSAHVDTLVIVKAKEGQAEAVESALEAYHQNLLGNTMQYPSNLGKIQASKVERIGSYVCFVLLGGDIMEQEEQGDEAVIAHCQEENDRVIGIISANIDQ